MDTSLVFTCSTEIIATLKMNATVAPWISNAYSLTFGSLLLLGGKLGDVYGRKKVFIIGLIIFGAFSFIVGISQNTSMILISRALQGVGAAIIAPGTLAIIMDSYTGTKRIRAISIYGMMSGIGVSVGLIIGAGITTISSWRYGFLVNIPIVIFLVILSLKQLPKSNRIAQHLDLVGSIASFAGFLLIINGISGIGPHLISFILGIAAMIFLYLYEKKLINPVLSFKLFHSSTRLLAYLIRFIYSGAITGFWFFTPQLLQSHYQFTPIIVGLAFLPMTMFNFFSAGLVNRLTQIIGSRWLVFVGLIITTVGFSGLILFNDHANFWLQVILPMVVIGFGQGLVLSPITNLAVEKVEPDLSGMASGLINVMLQIGGAFGLAILSKASLFFSSYLQVFHIQSIGITTMSLISLLLTIRLLRFK
jgi:MFS family permease